MKAAKPSDQSCTGDRHIQKHQEYYGEMPLTLCEFLVSDASWDARLCAWLLYIVKKYSHQTDGLWSAYIKTLPKMSDLNLLLTFSPMEQMLLKIPWCVLAPLWIDSTAVVMCTHVHDARATLHAHLASTIHSTADRLTRKYLLFPLRVALGTVAL